MLLPPVARRRRRHRRSDTAQCTAVGLAPVGVEVGHQRQHARIVVAEAVAMARIARARRIRGVMRFDFGQAEEQAPVQFDAQRVERRAGSRVAAAPQRRSSSHSVASPRMPARMARPGRRARSRRRASAPAACSRCRSARRAMRRRGVGEARRCGRRRACAVPIGDRIGVVHGDGQGRSMPAIIAALPDARRRGSPMFSNLPPVTKALLIANGLVFLLQLLLGDANVRRRSCCGRWATAASIRTRRRRRSCRGSC